MACRIALAEMAQDIVHVNKLADLLVQGITSQVSKDLFFKSYYFIFLKNPEGTVRAICARVTLLRYAIIDLCFANSVLD